jgi:aspartyl/asparaginyl beta-hydroxylase (cupin superfamily)
MGNVSGAPPATRQHGIYTSQPTHHLIHPAPAIAGIAPHYGPCNIRVRVHLPLQVPSGTAAPPSAAGGQASGATLPPLGITVAGETRTWVEGEPLVFDDTYEHSTWNATSGERVVLLFDLWHPDLSAAEVGAVVDMFEGARRQGLLK